jgi:hypothetical protein
MKQTAVEWFFENLNSHKIEANANELFEQAKEMEKQQIVDAYNFSEIPHLFKWDAEQYYNETYKKP